MQGSFAADGRQSIDHTLGRDKLPTLEQIRGHGRLPAVEIIRIGYRYEDDRNAGQCGAEKPCAFARKQYVEKTVE